jgi:hypothetical protein
MFTPRRRCTLLATAIVMGLSTVACSDDGSDGNVEPLGPEPLSLTVSPASVKLFPGNAGTAEVRIAYGSPDAAPFTLAAIGMPEGVTVTFTPDVIPQGASSAAINVALAPAVVPGMHSIAIRATAATGEVRSGTLTLLTLTPEAPGFALLPSSSTIEVRPGGDAATTSIQVERHAAFAGEVAFAIERLPAGLVATLSSTRTADASVTLGVSAAADMAIGYHYFLMRGTAAGTADVLIAFRVTVRNPGDSLALSLDRSEVTLVAGGPAVDVRVDIMRAGSFAGAVDLDVEADPYGPVGIDARLAPRLGIAGTSATLTVQAGAGLVPGTYELWVRGWDSASGGAPPFVSDNTALTITVVAGT